MKALLLRAAIPVILAAAAACTSQIRVSETAPLPAGKLAELWERPADVASRDLLHGAGGAELAPPADGPFTWIATDTTGFSPGFEVRDSAGRTWDVKLGVEAQSEVVASRVLWALGYHQPPVYYVESWQLTGGPGGAQPAGRFRLEDSGEVVGDWSWSDNAFLATQPYRGLIVANIVLNNWDWKTSNNKIYRHAGGAGPALRYVVRDLGASLGATSPSRLLWVLPFPSRGFGQGSRNQIDDFEAQGFIEKVDEHHVDFDFDTIYGAVVDLVRPSDVRWTAELLNQVTDDQWDAAFRAAHYSSDLRARFIRKIKAKIAEGLAVS